MNEPYREHPNEEALERFLLNMSSEEEREILETHVLACEYCVDQLETLETQIAATRLALRNLLARPPTKRLVDRFGRWRAWFTIPKLSFAAAGVAMAAGAILFSIPRDVSMTAYRGLETAIVSEGRPLHMHLNAAGLTSDRIAIELVDRRGSIVWKGNATIRHDTVDVTLPRITQSGPYFLRLYSAPQHGAEASLLREFAFEARWMI
jgi:transposase